MKLSTNHTGTNTITASVNAKIALSSAARTVVMLEVILGGILRFCIRDGHGRRSQIHRKFIVLN